MSTGAVVNPNTLSLNTIVDITVYVTPAAAARQTFNQGLVLGTSARIPSATRLVAFTSASAMLQAPYNFQNTDPEYLAALAYFAQTPAPVYLWVGRQDLTALQTVIPNAANKGTGYVEGDIITVGAGTLGTLEVATVDVHGAVTALTLLTGGTGYSVNTGVATTTNSTHGAALEVDISAIGESCVVALQACRNKNWDWYAAVCLASVDGDQVGIAEVVESLSPSTIYLYQTQDMLALAGSVSSFAYTLMNEEYSRTFGVWSTINAQVTAPGTNTIVSGPFAAVAIMGRAMGLNTGLANSAWTIMFKNLVTCQTENISVNQVLNLQGLNLNMYVSYANYYEWTQFGSMANGYWLDQVVNRDMLVNNMQLSVADLLNQAVKVPQTDPGMTMIAHVINQACQQAVTIGYLAPGTWTGIPLLNLNTGDQLPQGYLTQTIPVAQQATADRDARKSTPFYCSCIEAGAIQAVQISIYVQQ